MADEANIRLILELLGVDSVERATEKLQQLKQATSETYEVEGKLGEGYKLAADAADAAADRAVAAAVERTRAQNILRQALEEDAAAQAALATTTATTASKTGDMGRGVLQASYAAQDFISVLTGGGGLARALGAVSNNIAPLVTGFGMGAGAAGVIQLATTVFAAAVPVVQKFGESLLGLEEKAEKLKEFNDQMERLRKNAEAMEKNPADATARFIEEQFKGESARSLRRGIEATLKEQGAGLTEWEQYNLEHAQKVIDESPSWMPVDAEKETIRKLLEIQAQRNVDRAREIMGNLAESKGARSTVRGMIEQRPGYFAKDAGRLLEQAEPEYMADIKRRQDAAEADLRLAEQKEADWKRSRKDAADAQARQTKESNQAQADEEAGIEAASRAAEQDQEKAAREAERAAREAEQERKQAAREAEQERKQAAREAEQERKQAANQLRAMQAAQQDAVTGEVLREAKAAGVPAAYAGDLQNLVRQAVSDLPANNGDVVSAIAQAAREGYAMAQRQNRQDLMELYAAMHQQTESFYGGM